MPSLRELWVNLIEPELYSLSLSASQTMRRSRAVQKFVHKPVTMFSRLQSHLTCQRKCGRLTLTLRQRMGRLARPVAYMGHSYSAQNMSKYGPASLSLRPSRRTVSRESDNSCHKGRTTLGIASLILRKRERCCQRHGLTQSNHTRQVAQTHRRISLKSRRNYPSRLRNEDQSHPMILSHKMVQQGKELLQQSRCLQMRTVILI